MRVTMPERAAERLPGRPSDPDDQRSGRPSDPDDQRSGRPFGPYGRPQNAAWRAPDTGGQPPDGRDRLPSRAVRRVAAVAVVVLAALVWPSGETAPQRAWPGSADAAASPPPPRSARAAPAPRWRPDIAAAARY